VWRRVAEVARGGDAETLARVGEALFSAGDDDEARPVLEQAVETAREHAALAALPIALSVLSLVELRSGRLRSAHTNALESYELMRALDQHSEQATAAGRVAWIEAMLGREAECRAHTREAHDLLEKLGLPGPYGNSPIGLLELSLGRLDEAIEGLDTTVRRRKKVFPAGEAAAARPVFPSLFEAYGRAGRGDEIREDLAGALRGAERIGRGFAMAPLLRVRALIDEDESGFLEALGWHDRWGNSFERARTELAYGELLRRRKRRAEARPLLRAAVENFEGVGAVIWAQRARTELAATGERARRRVPSTIDDLTPQELRVAGLVATGLTNREVATRLFLSPKTIETHLAHVFRKTEVRTRAELAHRFRDSPDSIAAPAS
jgi:DNA-binding CsgD family transcriptional regulator